MTEGGVCQKEGLWQAGSKVGEGRGRGKGPVSPSEGSGEGFLASTLPNTSEADGGICQKAGVWQADSKVGEGRGRGKGPGVCQKRKGGINQQEGIQSSINLGTCFSNTRCCISRSFRKGASRGKGAGRQLVICENFFRSNAPGQRRVDSRPGVCWASLKRKCSAKQQLLPGFSGGLLHGTGGRWQRPSVKKGFGLGWAATRQQRVGKEGRDANSSLQHIPGLWQLILAHVSAHICF